MLELNYYWILVFIAMLGLAYWLGATSSKIDNSAQSEEDKSGSRVVDVIVEVPKEAYGKHLVTIDNVAGGIENNFTTFMVRDSISAHTLTGQNYALSTADRDYLLAIGAGRRTHTAKIGVVTYRIQFKRSENGTSTL